MTALEQALSWAIAVADQRAEKWDAEHHAERAHIFRNHAAVLRRHVASDKNDQPQEGS